MDASVALDVNLETPAFVYDEGALEAQLQRAGQLQGRTGIAVRFSLKAFSVLGGVRLIAARLGGLEASSVFEAMLARRVLGAEGRVHFTSPGVRPRDVSQVLAHCDYVSANSLHQLREFTGVVRGAGPQFGLRVNPGLSFAKDARFDPAANTSKLGVPLAEARELFRSRDGLSRWVSGLHFHSNCESTRYSQLLATVQHLDRELPEVLSRVSWVNLGGGYLVDEAEDEEHLRAAAELLRGRYEVELFMEPGEGLVRQAGWIVTTVLDVFERHGSRIAIVDTTVNHMPEIFEYGGAPEVVEADPQGPDEYSVVGCSCLAGDKLGTYRFESPLQPGTRLVIKNAGAYTLVKAHMFNGINLPQIYRLGPGGLRLERAYDFGDFLERCGGPAGELGVGAM